MACTEVPFSFEAAAARQSRYGSYYTVWLVRADGVREYMGFTAKKSRIGLLKVLRGERMQERIKQEPNADQLRMTLGKNVLELDNGMRVEFGGTIRQEAAAKS